MVCPKSLFRFLQPQPLGSDKYLYDNEEIYNLWAEGATSKTMFSKLFILFKKREIDFFNRILYIQNYNLKYFK